MGITFYVHTSSYMRKCIEAAAFACCEVSRNRRNMKLAGRKATLVSLYRIENSDRLLFIVT